MPFELSRRYARLPRWARLCVEILAPTLGTAAVLAVFALVVRGPSDFAPFGPGWPSLVLFGALYMLANVLSNAAYARFHAWERERLPSAGAFFRNHDLARLVGQSIGMILRACEADLPDGDARLVHRLALRAEADWPVIAAGERARERLPQIGDRALVAFVRDPSRPALTDAQIDTLLALLSPSARGDDPGGDQDEPPAFADPETGPRVRAALAGRFGEALRQALKRDFARRGGAAFGIWLDIAGALLAPGRRPPAAHRGQRRRRARRRDQAQSQPALLGAWGPPRHGRRGPARPHARARRAPGCHLPRRPDRGPRLRAARPHHP